ncbi:hypothetical protein ASC66_01190 [Leifsonia sp. Root4]|uniref:hypothetical protein n=1 Tax=Leifsonia sp. Root4 TaxID=1736525 RepID=UPI0006F3B49F|nr:hypothetical protein [Leifsonia sp. Root4]KQW07643.1 hypothetical protein ASC66_01190 [Leifsonia sp. Root4]
MDDINLIRVWKLGSWRVKRGSGYDGIAHVFWADKTLFSIRFGRHGRRLFSERNQHLPSIQNRWHYFLGKRVTIITRRKENPNG